MDRHFVRAHLSRILDDTTLDLPGHYRGKVRDSWTLGDGRRVMVASDRLSAFDRILCTVPFKGQVLTQTARFWFEATADIVPNHVIAYPDPNVLVCRELRMLPVEMVVRGYLAGTTSTSILTLYRRGERTMYGTTLPDGLAANQCLPQPILTPTTKESATGHDEPLSPAEIVASGLIDAARWEEMAAAALALFARGQEMATARGLILADTKYEFGIDEAGRLVLADEIHTPDSSRFWKAESYGGRLAAGQAPESFDKDVIRAWVAAHCDPYRDAVPAIPEELIVDTALVYAEAFERITGAAFVPDVAGETVLERVRGNLMSILPGTGRGTAAR